MESFLWKIVIVECKRESLGFKTPQGRRCPDETKATHLPYPI
jgi:hypothetical protein